MLVYESIESCISVCTCAKSTIHLLSHPIPITDVSLQGSVPVKVPGRGGGSGLVARLGVTVRGIVTTTLMVTCGIVVVCCAASI
jgi:hypothetical protein